MLQVMNPKTVVSPSSIMKALKKTMDRDRKALVFSSYVPDSYRIVLAADVYNRLRPVLEMMREQMTQELAAIIERKHFRLLSSHVRVAFVQGRSGESEPPFMIQGEFTRPDPPSRPARPIPAGVPCLIERLPGKSGRFIALDRECVVLGRGDDADFRSQSDDSSISRRHAAVCKQADQFMIEDLDSSNGVFVNGLQVRGKNLEDGDIVDLGAWRLEFCSAGEQR